MAYIGPEPNPGQNREVDDISSGFNGSETAFTLQVNSQNVSPGSSNAIIVSVGGVIQNPGTDYTIAASTITFTTAPASGLSFFGLVLGQQVDTEGFADGGTLNNPVTTGDLSIADKIIHTGDTNTAIRFPANDTISFETSGTESFRLDSSQRFLKGITTARGNFANNTSGVDYKFQIEGTGALESTLALVRNSNDAADGGIVIGKTRSASVGGNTVLQAGDDLGSITWAGADGTTLQFGAQITAEVASGVGNDDMPSDLLFFTNSGSTSLTEAMRINSSGKVGINTTSPVGKLTIDENNASEHFQLRNTTNTSNFSAFGVDTSFNLRVYVNQNERMRINSSGDVNINNTGGLDAYRLAGSGSSLRGHLFKGDGRQANTTNDSQLLTLNRLESDGQMITFSHNGSQEGSISSSGSTISYNGGHLSRWSQLKGISSTDKSARPTIYQGTVMSNLDDLCEWSHSEVLYKEDVLYTEEDTIPEGKSVGDIKHAKGSVLRAAYTEENQQLNMTKISDTVGDKDVAGVFWAWDDEDDEIVNDFYIAMTGDMVIRVAASTTVARGDLLISAGDGTAKPQDDDIVRSSTIAKIISTNHTATYPDGSKAYPCVLMAC